MFCIGSLQGPGQDLSGLQQVRDSKPQNKLHSHPWIVVKAIPSLPNKTPFQRTTRLKSGGFIEQTEVMSHIPSTTVNTHTVMMEPCRFSARVELRTNLKPSVRTWFPYYGVQRQSSAEQ